MLLPHAQAHYSPTGAAPRAGTPVDAWNALRHTRARAPLWEKGSVSPDRSHPPSRGGEGVGEGRRRDGAQPPNSQGSQDTERTGPRGATLGDPQTVRAPHSRSDQNPYDRRPTQSPSMRHREPVTPWRQGWGQGTKTVSHSQDVRGPPVRGPTQSCLRATTARASHPREGAETEAVSPPSG